MLFNSSSFQKCQFGDKCGNPPNEKLAMNQYAKHLVIDHNVPLTFGPVTIVRVPVTEFAKYRKGENYVIYKSNGLQFKSSLICFFCSQMLYNKPDSNWSRYLRFNFHRE